MLVSMLVCVKEVDNLALAALLNNTLVRARCALAA